MGEGSEVGTDAHVIEEERGVEIPSEPDTPSRKSYISSSEGGESGDSGSECELSDHDERHNYVAFEDIKSLHGSESDILTEEEDEEEDEELRGRRHVRARSRKSGRRLVGGRRGRRRRGLKRASSSRSHSSIEIGGEGDDDGWVEVNNPPTIHPFSATPGLTCGVPTLPLGSFQLFVPLEFFIYFFFFLRKPMITPTTNARKCVRSRRTRGTAWMCRTLGNT